MRLTAAQSELCRHISRRMKRGVRFDFLKAEFGSGLSTALRAVLRKRGPRSSSRQVLNIFGGAKWEVVLQLCAAAEITAYEGYSGSTRKALAILSDNGRRPLSIVLESAETMSAKDMAFILKVLEFSARAAGASVRFVVAINKLHMWDQASMKFVYGFPELPARFFARVRTGQSTCLHFTRNELRKMSFERSRERATEAAGVQKRSASKHANKAAA